MANWEPEELLVEVKAATSCAISQWSADGSGNEEGLHIQIETLLSAASTSAT